MRNVHAKSLFLSDLFRLQLCIPDYQRGYCWEKKHVDSLLESLAYADLGDGNEEERAYHLGTIILHKHKKNQKYCCTCNLADESCNVYDVVDGQQRLLTLSLIVRSLNQMDNFFLPLFKSETRDPDVIRHVYQNWQAINDWRKCHSSECNSIISMLGMLKFTVVIIENNNSCNTNQSSNIDPSLQLAWTFFNSINSGGKQLSDYDLLKAHHLRYLAKSSKSNDDALIYHKAARWDAGGKESILSIGNAKVPLYESLLAHTVYPIRSWLRNRRIQFLGVPADVKYCVLNHYSALLSFSCTDGTMSGLTDGVIGGKPFFDWTEYWTWQYRRFCDNPIVSRFLCVPWKSAQFHLRLIARSILFYYFCRFGDLYLADACLFILYRIGRLRNRTARSKDSWYGNRGDELCVPHTIIALDESPSPEYFFRYCQLPSNRYVRYYNLKDDNYNLKDDNTKQEYVTLLKSWRHGPDWWKRLLVFASSSVEQKNVAYDMLSSKRENPKDYCIGDSVYYKKEIAGLLQNTASDFGWEFNEDTLVLSAKQPEKNKQR